MCSPVSTVPFGKTHVGYELMPLSLQIWVCPLPSGVEHSVKNDVGGNLTLLVFMAPHPGKKT